VVARKFNIKIYADGADLLAMRALADDPLIEGFTTNPSLMRRAGVGDYAAFAREALAIAGGRPVSFEVLADDFGEMRRQAEVIAGWGDAAYVKIPVIDSRGNSAALLIASLLKAGIKVNVTAVFTHAQVAELMRAVPTHASPLIISVFAGRISDAGRNPLGEVVLCAWEAGRSNSGAVEMLWASPRQVYDVKMAARAGCSIITMTPDLIAKLPLIGKDLNEFSRETVEMFARDAQAAGYVI